ncbi:MAG: beta-N-acetylhexosaminidase [Pseudomonadota bacterium]
MLSPGDREERSTRLNAAAIVGISGTTLTPEEIELYASKRPSGFILFARNCESPDQVASLVRSLRLAVNDAHVPILIDQEGGRVTRLKPPYWQMLPPLRRIGECAKHAPELAKEAAWLHARLVASDLEPLGITINCSPVLDLGLKGQTEAIGDRAFSEDPSIVGELGQAMIEGFLDGGVIPVIKHLPGHGRATVDSHAHLPRVSAHRDILAAADWQPFRQNAEAPLGMTAHILFPALDLACCATQSSTIINDIIRGEIGFSGALLSDDLSMEALGGSLGERARRAIEAGCDLALHCNGAMAEMTAVLTASGPLEGGSLKRFNQALSMKRPPEPFDARAGRERLISLLVPFARESEAPS